MAARVIRQRRVRRTTPSEKITKGARTRDMRDGHSCQQPIMENLGHVSSIPPNLCERSRI